MKSKTISIALFLFFFLSTAVSARSLNARFMDAAELGDIITVKKLVAQGADINYKPSDKRTALHWASNKGKFVVVKYLIENGADVDAMAFDGSTPLMFAASGNKLAIVKLLVEYGADVNLQRNGGYTALHSAKKTKNSEAIVKYLIENGSK